jgi:hypothetical protein
MAALDFPNSPTANQIFTAPDGTQWKWDGVKWVPAGAGGAGTVTSVTTGAGLTGGTITTSGTIALGIPVPVADGGTNATAAAAALANLGGLPLAGVTNGSNAAAGQIGEFLSSVQTANVSIAATTATNITSLVLTAGDWDVSGEAQVLTSSPSASIQAMINTVSATIPSPGISTATGYVAVIASSGSNLGGAQLAIARVRINVSASTTVYLIGYANQAGTGTGKLTARRMR